MKHTKHYWRALFIILGALFVFLVVRAFLVPESFHKYGFYRGNNVAEQMGLKPVYGKKDACTDCHGDTVKLHAAAKHQSVQCQNCHAPLTRHIVDGEMVELMPIDRSPKLCLRCHRALPSRPKDFPQIIAKDHVGVVEEELEMGACLKCHNAHQPDPNTEVTQPATKTVEPKVNVITGTQQGGQGHE